MTKGFDKLPPDADFPALADVSAADEAAAAWVARLSSGETTADERAEFARWRAADPAHEAALAGMRGLWLDLERILHTPATIAAPAVPVRRSRRGLRRWAIAASLLLATALGFGIAAPWRHDQTTATGERRTVVLDDGSRIDLSGATALDVRFDSVSRRIELVRGEAYFDVAGDTARPFVVDAGAGAVRVVGTRFALRRDGTALRVIVEHGAVALLTGASVADTLGAGQRSELHRGRWSEPAAADPERELAWRSGRLTFRNVALAEIVDELAPHYRGRLIVLDARLRTQPFSAVVDLDRVDDWIASLDELASVNVMRIGPLTIVH